MKLYKIIVVAFVVTMSSIHAIKESSKQMLVSNCPTAYLFTHTKKAIQDLPLSASADKYADLLLDMAKSMAGYPKGPRGAYFEHASQMCDLVEKLSKVEKVTKRKLEKARKIKAKIQSGRFPIWTGNSFLDLFTGYLFV